MIISMKLDIVTFCVVVSCYVVYAKGPSKTQTNIKKTHWVTDKKNEKKLTATEGSGHSEEDDDRYDDYEGSAEGSGESYNNKQVNGEKPSCLKLLEIANSHKMVGAFVPRCTFDGAFEPLQCHGVTGECWCSSRDGRKIPGTIRKAPDMPKCDNPNNIVILDKQPRTSRSNWMATTKVYFGSQTIGEFAHKATVSGSRGKIIVGGIESHDNSGKFDGKEVMVPYKTLNNEGNVISKDGRKISRNKIGYERHDNVHSEDSDERNQISASRAAIVMARPGVLAGTICAGVVLVLCFVTFVTFIAYKLKRKSYYRAEEKSKIKSPVGNGCGANGYGDIYAGGFSYTSSPAKYQTATKMSSWSGLNANNSITYSGRQDREFYG